MNLLPDTNTLSYILRSRQPVLNHFEAALRQECSFFLAPVAHYELLRYLDLKGADRLLRLYKSLVSGWRRCELTFDDWDEAAHLWAERHSTGRSVSDLDLLLAILARKHDAVLVTSNTRHFESLGISLADWTLP
jgi:predicted nucleic acid-binding protein